MGAVFFKEWYQARRLPLAGPVLAVMFALAALYLKDGRPEQAKNTLLSLLALEPASHDAVNLLEEVEHTLEGAKRAL